jgi:hypothetical protein
MVYLASQQSYMSWRSDSNSLAYSVVHRWGSGESVGFLLDARLYFHVHRYIKIFLLFWDWVQTAQDGIELMIFLPQPPN